MKTRSGSGRFARSGVRVHDASPLATGSFAWHAVPVPPGVPWIPAPGLREPADSRWCLTEDAVLFRNRCRIAWLTLSALIEDPGELLFAWPALTAGRRAIRSRPVRARFRRGVLAIQFRENRQDDPSLFGKGRQGD